MYAHLNELHEQPHDRKYRNRDQHHALSGFQGFRQTDHHEHGESEDDQDEQH